MAQIEQLRREAEKDAESALAQYTAIQRFLGVLTILEGMNDGDDRAKVESAVLHAMKGLREIRKRLWAEPPRIG